MKKKILLILSFLFVAPIAHAHEAYVLDHDFFWGELSKPFNTSSWKALENPHNFYLTILIASSILLLLALNFMLRQTKIGLKMHRALERFSEYGPLFVRITIAIGFFFSAYGMKFLGPELALSSMPFPHLLQILLYIVSICIALGIFTEIAALIALVIFCLGFFVYGSYIFTYLNYLGEIITLLLFGMRKWSFDAKFFGPQKNFLWLQKYEISIIRIFYGLALAYAAIAIKFLHPALTLEVVNHWNLTQFSWLFPGDPLLVTFGAGMAELAIGIFIIIGFEMRLIVLISLFYITLSLFFFGESVWPHLLLYGISLDLLVQPETFTMDDLFFERKKSK